MKKLILALISCLLLIIVAFNFWGALTLGKIKPDPNAVRDALANRVVMVFGATGSVGDGLLKAAIQDPSVEKVYVVTRRSSPRIEAGIVSGKVEMTILKDFTDYTALNKVLGQVNTVLWGLGTSSFNVDDNTYTLIHVDFPVAFVKAWLAARTEAPMSFHSVTGMGTDPNGSAHWAREKGRAEQEVAELASGSGLHTFAYRSAFIRPSSEQANILHRLLALLLQPGKLVITATELGEAMLEISARSSELPNGSVIDNADSIAYARLYARQQ
ncbi:MAG: hypothetical protein ACI8QT_001856 [Halioglobus sp.]|jgi:hypothetical protein